MVNDMILLNDMEVLLHHPVVIFGCSNDTYEAAGILRKLNTEKFCFCDSNLKKCGQLFQGKEVITKEELIRRDRAEKICIMIGSRRYWKEISAELEEMHVSTEYIFSCYIMKLALYFNRNRTFIPAALKEELDLLWKTEALHCKSDFQAAIDNECTYAYYQQLFGKIVHIYNPGKVGSKSVFTSCIQNHMTASHMHMILPCEMSETEKKALINTYRRQDNVRIISLLREPISRDISFFFENIWIDTYFSRKETIYDAFFTWMEKCLYKTDMGDNEYPAWYRGMNQPVFQWFQEEFFKVFDIDIRRYPFDREKGYTIIRKGNVQLLLIQLEKLDRMEAVIGDFLEDQKFRLYKTNDSADKEYHDLYKEFSRTVKIPKQYFEYYYADNEDMRHFYLDSEIQHFKDRWEKQVEENN